MIELNGVVPVIPIPFKDDESIDVGSLRRAVDWVAGQKLAGMCLPAYGSEFYKLDEREREEVVGIAIEANCRRVPVIAQANHGSSRVAAATARRYEKMGADLIAFAIPRQFRTTEADLLRYCGRICDAVSTPVLVQDFNPDGATIGADFIHALHRQHGNFRYAKLEEPMIINKLTEIRDRVGGEVGILEGWGGYYMLEAIPAGCCGIMPGVPIADLLNRVFRARQSAENERAYDLLGSLLPFINFTLQDFELFLQVEKQLLVCRGIFDTAVLRSLTYSPTPATLQYVSFLIAQIVRVLQRENIPLKREAN